jgi:hypothetical protein
VRKFPGVEYDLATISGDPEPGKLLDQIDAALSEGGWSCVNYSAGSPIKLNRGNRPMAGIISVTGIYVSINEEASGLLAGPAGAVAAALQAEGLPVTLRAIPNAKYKNVNAVHLAVGKKGK